MGYKLISRAVVSDYRGGESKASTYDKIKKGLLPPPLKLGAKSLWPLAEIKAINSAVIAGKSDAEIKALVQELIAARATAA